MDVHCHYTPADTENEEARWRLYNMSHRGIAMQMLSYVPQDINELERSNDYGASFVKSYPDRFGLLAALPTGNCEAALAEVKRATEKLHADGFAMACCYNGTYLSDPTLGPLWMELNRKSAVVFVHPSVNPNASFGHGQSAAALEVVFEMTRTIVDMLCAGIFKNYQDIKFIIGHCDGALPALSGWLSLIGTETWIPSLGNITSEEISTQLRRLYVDSTAAATVHSLAAALKVVGPDHLVYGSDSGAPCSTKETVDNNLRSFLSFPGLTKRQIQDAGTTNLRGLFPSASLRLAKSYQLNDKSDRPLVRTPSGALQGCAEDGVYVFRGIPFAEPPVAERRFCPPVPLIWEDIYNATKSGPASYQVNRHNKQRVEDFVGRLDHGAPGVEPWPPYVGGTYNQEVVSEDCLYMDIWVPEMTPGRKYPVLVYYHGGANAVSSGSFSLERGSNLAKQENIIVVRPNYRLGALGWVHLSLVSDEFPDATNLGFQDQIAALYWVYDNIEAFGGDRGNITISGESCGATAVSHLLCYSGTQRLVKRAIMQSFSPFNVWCTQRKEEAVKVALRYMEILGIEDPAQLHDIEPEAFLAVHKILLRQFGPDANLAWSPVGGVVDGDLIPETPALALSQNLFPRKDFQLMIGFAKDEWQFFRGHTSTIQNGSEAEVLAVLAQVFGEDHARSVFRSYQEMYPSRDPGHLLGDIMSMEFFKFPSLSIANNFASQGVPTYIFQFSFDLPGLGGSMRALHTGDIPFIFRNHTGRDLDMWPPFEGVDSGAVAQTAEAFSKLYGSFVRHGDPGRGWPPFNHETQEVLWVGKSIKPKEHLLSKELRCFEREGVGDLPILQARLVRNVRKAFYETRF